MDTSRASRFTAARAAVMLFIVAAVAGCVATPSVPSAARSELAPTGKLRVGLLATNATYVTKDGDAEQIQGVAVDIGRELAKQLGVAFEPVRYKSVSGLLQGAESGDWDVAFVGHAPAGRPGMDFTAPYAEVANTYIVRADSSIKTVADADTPEHRIAAQARSSQYAHISRNLKRAQAVTVATTPAGLDLIAQGKAHAYVGPRVSLSRLAATKPGLRVADGTLFSLKQALAVAKGRPAGTAYAKEFIEHAKASGLVQEAIQRAGLQGVSVAPAASTH